ncbi:hypothetical protein B0I35DRAFT_407831 [Stachybotrys elegans]|uniref:Enoyl reductase (ER) domain-containing protein n=1 Tax=Stachybotrys elegans TaxID=80388 RepID=A0A8K0STS4_9HYPO|nr:hypothetical protein B0I35DRAFT_407831 [Stachybotrys elegans]
MKQWITALDGLDKLQFGEAERPSPKDGEVLVKIEAVSLNYRDTEVIMGLYVHHKSIGAATSLVPCSDMCGTVVESKSSDLAEGTRVMSIFNQTHQTGKPKESDMASGLGLPLNGVLTEYRVFPASGLVAAPAYMTPEEASCLPIAAVTAWMSINSLRPLGEPLDYTGDKSGGGAERETVLLQGTGGVSISGLQIAAAAGLRTIITSSSDDKLARARDELGADVGINYRTHWEWQEPVLQATGGRGADVILETGGAQTLRRSFDCVAFGGVINCIGYLSGKQEAAPAPGEENRLNVNVLALRRNATLRGIINGPRDRFEEMVAFYARHRIRPVVDRVFPFDKADEALKYLHSGGHFGKVVVKVAA